MFVYQRSYLFCTSPLNNLPKKNLEPVLTYLLSAEDIKPYQLGLDGIRFYLSYRIHISDIFSDFAEEIKRISPIWLSKPMKWTTIWPDTFGCEFSEYAKKDAI